MSQRRLSPRGQSLVEFAILIPVFVLIVMMIFDLGRAVYYYSAIYNAAREGARNGVVSRNTTQMENTAKNYAFGLSLDPATLNVLATYFPAPTYRVRVAVTYAYVPITPIVANFLPGGALTLRSQTEMETEE